LAKPPNGWHYPLVGGTRQRHFDGTHFKPHKIPENVPTPTITPALAPGASVAPAFFAGCTLCWAFFTKSLFDTPSVFPY